MSHIQVLKRLCDYYQKMFDTLEASLNVYKPQIESEDESVSTHAKERLEELVPRWKLVKAELSALKWVLKSHEPPSSPKVRAKSRKS